MSLAHYICELRNLGIKIETRMARENGEQFGIYELQGEMTTRGHFPPAWAEGGRMATNSAKAGFFKKSMGVSKRTSTRTST